MKKTVIIVSAIVLIASGCRSKTDRIITDTIALDDWKQVENRINASHLFVLQQNKINRNFHFTFSNETDVLTQDIIYLGNIKMQNGNIIKLLYEYRMFGNNYSPHGRQSLFLFDKTNKFLKEYACFSYNFDFLPKICDNKLILKEICNENTKAKTIDFYDNIPDFIITPCGTSTY
jgi:hypothetical protein